MLKSLCTGRVLVLFLQSCYFSCLILYLFSKLLALIGRRSVRMLKFLCTGRVLVLFFNPVASRVQFNISLQVSFVNWKNICEDIDEVYMYR